MTIEARQAVYRRAATWPAAKDQYPEAIYYALASRDLALTADLVDQAARHTFVWSCAYLVSLLEWIKALPEAELLARLHLILAAVRAYLLGGQVEQADRLLEELGNQGLHAPGAEAAGMQGMSAGYRATICHMRGEAWQALQLAD